MDWQAVLKPLSLGRPRKIGCTDILRQAAARIEAPATSKPSIASTSVSATEKNLGMAKRPREEDPTIDLAELCEMRKKIRFSPESILQMQRDEERRDYLQPDPFSLNSREARPLNQRPPEDGSSPFLNIPPEIRLQIYQYLLPNGKGFLFCPSLFRNALTEKLPDPKFNLFKVSKLVSREASSVIYGQNILRLHPQSEHGTAKANEVAKELSLISNNNRLLIRNVEIHIGPLDYFDVAVKLYVLVTSRCPELHRLRVLVHKTRFDNGTPLFPMRERPVLGELDSGLPTLEKLVIQSSHGHREAIDIPVVKPPPTL
ncbi:MAG: hypothetical protein M1836_002628 [Candelina mexicana]|nr:MAG: hypothetical protein M1836_002628 [Candelina mexicana]